MKTWQMIKELSENPNSVFENQTGVKVLTCDGILCYYETLHSVDILFVGDKEEWTKVPQEVTWQRAIEAWANGKDIKCVMDGLTTFKGYHNGNIYMQDDDHYGVDGSQILQGKWYIL